MANKKDKLDIIYEDKQMLVVNKPTHMLTVQNERGSEVTLYNKVYEYLHKKNQKVFIVHRLDKDTSGVVVFAKDQKLKEKLQENWNELARVREYFAVVEGNVEKGGTIKEYLKETKTLLTYSVKDKDGKLAITHYEPITHSKAFSTLRVTIDTGRKNQIRVAMQGINHPIVGDKKYGSTKNPLRRVCLHASRLVLTNPLTKQDMEFVAKRPQEFKIFNENK